MGSRQPNEKEGPSFYGKRRRVLAFVPLTVLLIATALAIAGGIDGWPNLSGHPSPRSATASNPAQGPSVVSPGGPGQIINSVGPIVNSVGESGIAVSSGTEGPTCLGCSTSATPLQHVGNRTTSEGIAIRVFTASISPPTPTTEALPSGAQTTEPSGCFPTRLVQAEISDAQAVTVASGALYGAAGTTTVVGSGEWGLSEGAPAAWVIVAVPSSVDLVVASFGSGTSDSMAPIDGIAVLATHLTSASATSSALPGAVASFNAKGSQVGSVVIGDGNLSLPPSCRPQLPVAPTLPKPGPQPAHGSSARKAVRKAFDTLYSAEPDSKKFVYLQDADSQVGKAGKAAAGTTPQVAAQSLPVVDRVIFTNKTHAAVLYQIDYNGSPVVGPKIGHAVLIGTTWKVTRTTYCGDIDGAHAGVTC
jgi:hypothetical protein